MSMEQKFFVCRHCGNMVAAVKSSGAPIVCCGEPMAALVPGTVDASLEKRIPVWTLEGNRVLVTVGAVKHPMQPEHFIEWVSLQTSSGNQRKALQPGQEPEVCFALCEGDQVEAVYAFCNKHGLWKG